MALRNRARANAELGELPQALQDLVAARSLSVRLAEFDRFDERGVAWADQILVGVLVKVGDFVDDESTHTLMVKFYDYWNPKDGSKGLRAAAALKKAQEDVKKEARWAHPYYWAAWVLWGIPE